MSTSDGQDGTAAVFNNAYGSKTIANTWSGIQTFSTDVIFNGNVTINGTPTRIESTVTTIKDANIDLNYGGSDATSEGSGITIVRTGTDGSIVYEDALTSKFKIGALGSEVEVVTTTGAQTLQSKTLTSPIINFANTDYGTASDTQRLILPNAVTATLTGLTDTLGLFAYDTTLGLPVYNKGSAYLPLADQDGTQTLTNKTFTTPNFNTSASYLSEAEIRFNESNGDGLNYVGFKSPADLAGVDQIYTLPAVDGSSTDVLQTDGAGITSWVAAGGGGGTPGGSDTHVQFNDGGAFGGEVGMVYNKTTDVLTVAGNYLCDLGAVGDPAYSFNGDSDTGMYSTGANGLDFACAATRVLGLTTAGIFHVDGSQATPAIKFLLDADTGIWRSAANTLNISCGNTEIAEFDSTSINFSVPIHLNAGSAAAPAYAMALGGGDTGMYGISNGVLGLSSNGTLALTIDASQQATFAAHVIADTLTVTNDIIGSNLTASSDVQTGTSKELISVSDKRQKNHIKEIEDGSLDKICSIIPSYYSWKNDKTNTKQLGFYAQDVAPYIPEAAPYDKENDAYGFNSRAVIAHLVKAVQELNKKLKAV